MSKWHLIENQPLLRETFKEPPLISYKMVCPFKDALVKAKILQWLKHQRESRTGLSTTFHTLRATWSV